MTTEEAVSGGWFTSAKAAEAYRAKGTGPAYVLRTRARHFRRLYHVDDLDAWMRGTGRQCERCKRVKELELEIERLQEQLGVQP